MTKKIKAKATEDCSIGLLLDEELLSYASRMGCKTEMDFTMFLRARESILSL